MCHTILFASQVSFYTKLRFISCNRLKSVRIADREIQYLSRVQTTNKEAEVERLAKCKLYLATYGVHVNMHSTQDIVTASVGYQQQEVLAVDVSHNVSHTMSWGVDLDVAFSMYISGWSCTQPFETMFEPASVQIRLFYFAT